jgi:hypothetical protein
MSRVERAIELRGFHPTLVDALWRAGHWNRPDPVSTTCRGWGPGSSCVWAGYKFIARFSSLFLILSPSCQHLDSLPSAIILALLNLLRFKGKERTDRNNVLFYIHTERRKSVEISLWLQPYEPSSSWLLYLFIYCSLWKRPRSKFPFSYWESKADHQIKLLLRRNTCKSKALSRRTMIYEIRGLWTAT